MKGRPRPRIRVIIGDVMSTEFCREPLMILAPQVFHIEGYFEVYVKYVELMEFDRLTNVEDSLSDKETTLLDGGAAMPGHEDKEAGAPKGSGHDEDPDI